MSCIFPDDLEIIMWLNIWNQKNIEIASLFIKSADFIQFKKKLFNQNTYFGWSQKLCFWTFFSLVTQDVDISNDKAAF